MEGRKDSGEHLIALKVRELEALDNEYASKKKEFEERELERQKKLVAKQKLLDMRSREIGFKQRDLSLRENEMRAQLEKIEKEESELRLEKKKLADLEEALDVKIMMSDLKNEIFPGESSGAKQTQEKDSAAKVEGIERKSSGAGSTQEPDRSIRSESAAKMIFELDSSGKEIGESSRARAHASGSVQEGMNQGDGGFFFSMTMRWTHSHYDNLFLPKAFVCGFNWRGKTHVILLTEEGSFRLELRNYGPKQVLFRRGWRDFYRKNRLSIGVQCVFRLKKLCVNGDASVFSMDVSITSR